MPYDKGYMKYIKQIFKQKSATTEFNLIATNIGETDV
jgi:hypothetical protein